jgi:hypothetical protein
MNATPPVLRLNATPDIVRFGSLIEPIGQSGAVPSMKPMKRCVRFSESRPPNGSPISRRRRTRPSASAACCAVFRSGGGARPHQGLGVRRQETVCPSIELRRSRLGHAIREDRFGLRTEPGDPSQGLFDRVTLEILGNCQPRDEGGLTAVKSGPCERLRERLRLEVAWNELAGDLRKQIE